MKQIKISDKENKGSNATKVYNKINKQTNRQPG